MNALDDLRAEAADEGSCEAARLALDPPRRRPPVRRTRLARTELVDAAVARWLSDDPYTCEGGR